MPENYRFSIASVNTWWLGVWDLVFETLPLKFNRDGARAGRVPKRWYTRRILEDEQDTVQVLCTRKLQILDRINAHMMTWYVRPCFRDPPTQIQSWRSARRKNAKKVDTRRILEDKQDTVQILYPRKLHILDRIQGHVCTNAIENLQFPVVEYLYRSCLSSNIRLGYIRSH